MVRECGWRGLGETGTPGSPRAINPSRGCPSSLGTGCQFGMSVVNWGISELTAPVLENSLASCRGIFGHGLTLALVFDHGSRAQPRAGSECQTANPLPFLAEPVCCGKGAGPQCVFLSIPTHLPPWNRRAFTPQCSIGLESESVGPLSGC